MFKAKSALGAVLISIMSLSVPGALLARAPETVDDLYKVDSKKFDEVFLLPGVDFRPYTKVMIDDPEVAFERNWQRDYNRSSGSLSMNLPLKPEGAMDTEGGRSLRKPWRAPGAFAVLPAFKRVLRIRVELLVLAAMAAVNRRPMARPD